jgi:glucan-binding YG repeat protein
LKKFLVAMSLILALSLFSHAPNAITDNSASAATTYGWKYAGGKWYYYNSNGQKVTGWLLDGGKWYFLDSYGVMQTGWEKVGTKWYFLASNGEMKTGWVNTGGKWYYLNADGAMATGWKKVANTWYYLDGSGAMKTGWLSYGGKTYFLNSSGAMVTSWAKVSGSWYFFNASGEKQTGWVQSGSVWYFLNTNGTMKTGWLSSGGKMYYLDPTDGFMWTGWMELNDKYYFFYDHGAKAVNTTVDGITLGSDGTAIISNTGFFNTDLKFTIAQIIENHNSRSEVQINAVYDDANNMADFYGNGEVVAFAEKDFVWGHEELPEFLSYIALELGAPATPEEMAQLVDEAIANGRADNEKMEIVNTGVTLDFYWGMNY